MNLKQARQLNLITQAELSREVRLSQTQISHLEMGKCIPRISTRRKIEKFLDCRIDWLEERLKQPITTIGFAENESPEDQILKAIKVFLSGRNQGRKDKIKFLKKAISHFEREDKKGGSKNE